MTFIIQCIHLSREDGDFIKAQLVDYIEGYVKTSWKNHPKNSFALTLDFFKGH